MAKENKRREEKKRIKKEKKKSKGSRYVCRKWKNIIQTAKEALCI